MLPSPHSLLEYVFIFGEIPSNAEKGVYILSLVFLSYFIASVGAFTGLQLATDIHQAKTQKAKTILHYGGAFAFGTGIWSMHFIGMLAYHMDMVHTYDPFLTVLSMVIAVVIAYGVLQIIRAESLKIRHLTIGSVLLGAAICSMHYTGMAAMEMDADLRYVPLLFIASVLIAVTASGAALWIVFTLGQHEGNLKIVWQIVAALIMGAAICGMHYTGMAASVFIPYANCRYNPEQNHEALALAVAITSTAIFAIATVLSFRAKSVETKNVGMYSGSAVFIQLSLLLSVFLVLLVGSYVFLNNNILQQKNDSVWLNAASLQRTLIVQYAIRVPIIIASKSAQNWQEFNEHTKNIEEDKHRIDSNYRSLLEGGSIILNMKGEYAQDHHTHQVAQINDQNIRKQLLIARSEWEMLQNLGTSLMRSDVKNIVDDPRYENFEAHIVTAVRAQDAAVQIIQEYVENTNLMLVFKQKIILALGFFTFFLTLIYARFIIANRIERARRELKDHQENLESRVAEQTKDLQEAIIEIEQSKDKAERLNVQMQEYTDKLEEARLEQMDANRKIQKETETVKLLAKITNAINEAEDVAGAIQVCLDEICAFTKWPIGHAYILDDSSDQLVPSKRWFLNDEAQFMGFKEHTEKMFFSRSVGMPGRVLASGDPLWISNVEQDPNFTRTRIAQEVGVKTSLGFPVLIKKDVAAVLEFFAGDIEQPDSDLMQLMSSIGIQLGRIIERENIKKAKREAEKASRIKSEFLANMWHELRTPLNSIIGLSKILVEDVKDQSEEQHMISTIHKSASSLLNIVNDILDLSKIEAQQIILEKIPFDFKEATAAILETLAPIASARGLWLHYKYEKEGLPFLIGDPTRLSRILTNLVGNAIKYTERGEVEIRIDYSWIEERAIELFCSVKDTGRWSKRAMGRNFSST